MSVISKNTDFNFAASVLEWFEKNGRRQLPWQLDPTPYRVWVSEIMLQQTQVATVIPYYQKFMQAFPDIQTLASAQEDLVLHHWTGLGYYARARNLHKTAKIIHQQHQNIFPDSVEALSKLPGIGRSTAGAIIALASNKRAVILDGNVKRVLSRFHCVEGRPEQSATLKRLWSIADKYTPSRQCRSYTQAMMDLGATVCTRSSPRCPACPLQTQCEANLNDRIQEFPQKKTTKTLPVKATQMLILLSDNGTKVLLEKRPSQGIWGGLWAFPELDSEHALEDYISRHGLELEAASENWNEIRHTFSHFHLDIKPRLHYLKKASFSIMENQGGHWYDLKKPPELGLAAPVKKLLEKLEQEL